MSPRIKNLAKQHGFIDEDCKQHLTIELLLAIRRFDLGRYFKTAI
ncbi:helix-turn-helix domain-containing protein [Brevibacillus sp. SIMBA_040]